MNNFKNTASYILLSILLCNQTNATNVDNTEDSIIHSAVIYKYSDDQEEDTESFFPNNFLSIEEIEKELSALESVHINLIDQQVSDSVLKELLPYAHLIHGLSLSDNFFTNEVLNLLPSFSRLKYLDLANNSFIYPSLHSLEKLKHLSHLILTHNKIEASEIQDLRDKMPKLKVIFKPS